MKIARCTAAVMMVFILVFWDSLPLHACLLSEKTSHGKSGVIASKQQIILDTLGPNIYSIRVEHDVTTRETPGKGWLIRYPVYRFICEDIDGDGVPEALVGVIKTTRQDTVMRKRLFIYRQSGNTVRPMWLGSRLGMQLEDFSVMRSRGRTCIHTLEREKNGTRHAVGIWQWHVFGLRHVRYVARNKTMKDAVTIFQNSHGT